MSDNMQAKINELRGTIEQATGELKKLTDQIDIAKREEWVGLYFKVVQYQIMIDGTMADRLVSYYNIVDFNSGYLRYYGLLVEGAEYWKTGTAGGVPGGVRAGLGTAAGRVYEGVYE